MDGSGRGEALATRAGWLAGAAGGGGAAEGARLASSFWKLSSSIAGAGAEAIGADIPWTLSADGSPPAS
ncbi:hypothetical protein ACN28S_31295 [Cystobacter fuscus]